MTNEVMNGDDAAKLRKLWEVEEFTRLNWQAKLSEYKRLGEEVVAAKKNYDGASEDVRAFLESKRADLVLDAVYGDE